MRTAKAAIPWTRAKSWESRTVASVEPRATVTTRSKAFIFDSVRAQAKRIAMRAWAIENAR
jgi:hypothetical protein